MAKPRKGGKKKSTGGKNKKRKRANSWGENDNYVVESDRKELAPKRRETMHSQWTKQNIAKNRSIREKAKKMEAKSKSWIPSYESDKKEGDNDGISTEDSANSSSSDEDEEDEGNAGSSYSQLMSLFQHSNNAIVEQDQPCNSSSDNELEEDSNDNDVASINDEIDSELEGVDENIALEDEEDIVDGEIENVSPTFQDPYRVRYVTKEFSDTDEKALLALRAANPSQVPLPSAGDVRLKKHAAEYFHETDLQMSYQGTSSPPSLASTDILTSSNIRARLLMHWKKLDIGVDKFSPLQRSIFPSISTYRDLYFTNQTYENTSELRKTYLMHILNHTIKSRDTITKNNERKKKSEEKQKLAKKTSKDEIKTISNPVEDEFRDQGFTRPLVLILVPFRNSALKIVNEILKLLPETINHHYNKDRFFDEFSMEEKEGESVPSENEEYSKMFEGNVDDCFQLGISLSRKAIRFYTEYYHSDIILASPLGLRTQIGAEGESVRQYDFLSSIEVCVLDQSDVFHMQNWNHVLDIFSVLNNAPKESHDVDFSRVREWSLSNQMKYFRQNIILSSQMDPFLNSLISKYCWNFDGIVKLKTKKYLSGSIANVVPQVKQIFQRISCDSIILESDVRFEYFKKHIFENLLNKQQKHTLLYIPSYFDYVRIRNLFREHEKDFAISFCNCCEYTDDKEISRSRTTFFHGSNHVMLYTERFHFFQRFRIRGVRHVIFYGMPQYESFYTDTLNVLEEALAREKDESVSSIALFTKFDYFRLERIVGTKRASRMTRGKKDTYLFC